jgi:hypothetical protein
MMWLCKRSQAQLVTPTLAGLTAQVEQLELDKGRLEDECVELKYKLPEALWKFGKALSKYSTLKSKVDTLSLEY